MFISSLNVNNFRNLSNVALSDLKGINILSGDNAQGKTNLLESIYFLATLTSPRIKTYFDLIKKGEEYFSINAEVVKDNMKKTFAAKLNLTKELKVKINENEITKKGSYIGELKAVIFSPEDISIVKGAPSLRRKNLNILISQISKTYLDNLQRYYHILSQKNKLLQQINLKLQNESVLNVWNDQLAREGTAIILQRLKTVDFLNKHLNDIQKQISDQKEEIKLSYKSPVGISNDIENMFKEKLESIKEEEITRKVSLVGPHRDDVIFLINGLDAKYFASEGQQRSLSIGLKIAEYEFIKEQTNKEPVVLLDDIFFDLDEKRRKRVLNMFNKITQVFIAVTSDKDFKRDFNNLKIFIVKSGDIYSHG